MKRLACALALLLWAAGCGGGGDHPKKETTEAAGLSVCDPESALPGTKVTCRIDNKEFDEDCTVFFGNSPFEAGDKPGAGTYVFHEGEGTIDVLVPNVVFKLQDITYCCGGCDEPKMLAKGFRLEAPKGPGAGSEAKPKDDPAPSTGGAGTGDEDVLPGGGSPGGGGGTGGSGDTTADDDGDGVVNVIDACSGTPSGQSVNATGCAASQLPTPPGPAAASITKFNVVKAGSIAKPGTYKIEFQYANAKAAHLWGNIFNRTDGDADSPEKQRCGKMADGRYLLTKSDGGDWEGSEGADGYKKTIVKDLSTGVLCQGQDPATATGCKYKAPGSAVRFDIARRGLYFYATEHVYKADSAVLAGLAEIAERNPDCRVDLSKDDGSLITSDGGKLYTRSQVEYGKICLVVQGMDDQWKVQCKSVDAQDVVIAVGSNDIVPSSTKPVLSLDINYTGAVSPLAVSGCQKPDDSPAHENKDGNFRGECKITGDTMKLDLTAYGVGAKNVEKKSFEVKLQAPTLTYLGSAPCTDCEVDFKIQYMVSRPYTVKDLEDGKVIGSGNTPWVKSLDFFGQYVVNGNKQTDIKNRKVMSPGDANGQVTAHRDHNATSWSLTAYDFAGNAHTSKVLRQGYEYSFTFNNVKPPKCQYDDDCCDETLERARDGQIKLKGKNLKSVSCICNNGLGMRDGNVLKSVNEFTDITVQWDWGNCAGRDDDIRWNCSCTGEFLGPDESGNTSKTYDWTWCCEGDDFNEDDRECGNGNESGDWYHDC